MFYIGLMQVNYPICPIECCSTNNLPQFRYERAHETTADGIAALQSPNL